MDVFEHAKDESTRPPNRHVTKGFVRGVRPHPGASRWARCTRIRIFRRGLRNRAGAYRARQDGRAPTYTASRGARSKPPSRPPPDFRPLSGRGLPDTLVLLSTPPP